MRNRYNIHERRTAEPGIAPCGASPHTVGTLSGTSKRHRSRSVLASIRAASRPHSGADDRRPCADRSRVHVPLRSLSVPSRASASLGFWPLFDYQLDAGTASWATLVRDRRPRDRDKDGSARQVHDEGDEERRTQGQQRESGEQLGASRPRPNPTTQLASVRKGPRAPTEDRGDDAKEPQRDRERRNPEVDRVVSLEHVEAVRRQEDVSGAG